MGKGKGGGERVRGKGGTEEGGARYSNGSIGIAAYLDYSSAPAFLRHQAGAHYLVRADTGVIHG